VCASCASIRTGATSSISQLDRDIQRLTPSSSRRGENSTLYASLSSSCSSGVSEMYSIVSRPAAEETTLNKAAHTPLFLTTLISPLRSTTGHLAGSCTRTGIPRSLRRSDSVWLYQYQCYA
jgi:hypothetical protein